MISYIIDRMKKNYLLSKLPFVIITLAIIYIIYFLITIPKHSETYIYHVKSLDKNSKINVVDNDTNVYTNHIYADLYNTQNTKVGHVYSVNHHRKINNINHVTTLSTYITPNGTFTCSYYYDTTLNDHYFYGSMKHVISENETGKYNGKKINVTLDGKKDGKRIMHVTY